MKQLVILCLLFVVLPTTGNPTRDDLATAKLETSKLNQESHDDGARIYMERCALCHGSKALGEGPLPLLITNYPDTNLRKLVAEQSSAAITKAIVTGGTANPISEYSPPWQHEFSEDDLSLISDFIYLVQVDYTAAMDKIQALDAPASDTEGRRLFLARCQRCHGRNGQGDGPLAAILKTTPATNLTMSVLNEEDRYEIISQGGAAFGRSPQMPPWGQELTSIELKNLVSYLGTIVQKNPD